MLYKIETIFNSKKKLSIAEYGEIAAAMCSVLEQNTDQGIVCIESTLYSEESDRV